MKLEILDTTGTSLISMDDGSFLTPRVNPAQITSNQNDYDVGKGVFFRLSTDADRTITGFAGGASGRQMIIVQTSAFYLTLSNQSGSSTAANRIATVDGKNLILAQNEMAAMIWDVTTSRWRGYKLINTTIRINDASATAFQILEAANAYLNIDTTNGAEVLSYGNATTNPAHTFLGTGLTTLGGALTVTAAINSNSTTDSTSITTGSIQTDGGLGVAKAIIVGTDLKLSVVGGGVYVKEGTNATMGASAMVGGTVVVNTTKVTANSRIFLTSNTAGGTVAAVYISARTAGTSFTITSTNVLDTSTVAWMIMEPA